jgi:hypothetical protein
MPVGKRTAGSGFQVSFKTGSPLIIVKADCNDYSPWCELRGVWRAAFIMLGQALLEIVG